jgi:hypothetical protein
MRPSRSKTCPAQTSWWLASAEYACPRPGRSPSPRGATTPGDPVTPSGATGCDSRVCPPPRLSRCVDDRHAPRPRDNGTSTRVPCPTRTRPPSNAVGTSFACPQLHAPPSTPRPRTRCGTQVPPDTDSSAKAGLRLFCPLQSDGMRGNSTFRKKASARRDNC